jgi:uncharacterized Zn-binding protein involved in type VI secretion
MGQPAARKGDAVTGIDVHIVIVPGTPPVPTPLPHPFSGTIKSDTVASVKIEGAEAATVDSVAKNEPPHMPTAPGTSFQNPPSNQGKVSSGSQTVTIGGKAAARSGDPVRTCNDPADADTSLVAAGASTVTIG